MVEMRIMLQSKRKDGVVVYRRAKTEKESPPDSEFGIH